MSTDEQQPQLLIDGKWQNVTRESLLAMETSALEAAYRATAEYFPPTEVGFEGILLIENIYGSQPQFGGMLLAKQVLG